MHILLTDETNRQPSPHVRFFVYGGLLFPVSHLEIIHDCVEEIRSDLGYEPTDCLKFDTNARPDQVSIEEATDAKRRVLNLCVQLGCKFIVHVIHHRIIEKQEPADQVQWATDYVIGRFNKYLTEQDDTGMCIIDNLPHEGEFRYLADKFSSGLHVGEKDVPLDRIRLFAATCIGACHANSAMDIVLGSFRYCINDPQNLDAAKEMFPNLFDMMWHKNVQGEKRVRGYGLIFRPRIEQIRVEEYRKDYESLLESINSLLA